MGPWPWYVTGFLVGLFPAIMLIVGNRLLGVSANLRHACAIALPRWSDFFRYDWRSKGGWNLAFAVGILIGGAIATVFLANPEPIALAPAAQASLGALGVHDLTGLAPREIFSWQFLTTLRGAVMILGGGFLVGFGAAYAGGCTSGHGLAGLADLQLPSVIALCSFFAGGVIGTMVLIPMILA